MERLSHALFKAQEDESVLKEKTSSLRKSLQEAVASQSGHQSRLAALQKMLTEAERDKQLLQVSETGGKIQTALMINSLSSFWTNKEQLEEARTSAAEGKRSSTSISERIQSLQVELSQSERRREELEAELRNTQEVKRDAFIGCCSRLIIWQKLQNQTCVCLQPSSNSSFSPRQLLQQRSASLTEAQRSAQSAQLERATVEERLRGLQRAVAMLETEKKDAERQAVRLEKDKNALRNTLDKVRNTSTCTNVAPDDSLSPETLRLRVIFSIIAAWVTRSQALLSARLSGRS